MVFPTHRLLKARKAVHATRRLTACFEAWHAGRISFAAFDAAVQGWINHVRYADTWGLREHVLERFVWGPEASIMATKKNRDRALRGHSGQRNSGQ